jgi:hypothetical protein
MSHDQDGPGPSDPDLKRILGKTPMLERLTERENREIEAYLLAEVASIRAACPPRRLLSWRPVEALGLAAAFLLVSLGYQFIRTELEQARPTPRESQNSLERKEDEVIKFYWQGPSPIPQSATKVIESPTRTQLNWLPPEMLCGPRSVWVAAMRLGVSVDFDNTAAVCSITKRGSSLWSLKEGAEKLGLAAEGVRLDWEALLHLETPAILFVGGGHFCCVDPREKGEAENSGKLRVYDYPRATLWKDQSELGFSWKGEALAIRRLPPLSSPSGPRIEFSSLLEDFGVSENSMTAVFPFKNAGTEPLDILEVRKNCGCTKAFATQDHLAPGEEASIVMDLDLHGAEGAQNRTIEVITNDPRAESLGLVLQGLGKTSILVSTALVDFGEVLPTTPARAEFTLTDRSDPSLQIVGAGVELDPASSGPPPAVDVRWEKTAPLDKGEHESPKSPGKGPLAYKVSLQVHVPAGASLGAFKGHVRLTTNSDLRPDIVVPFQMEVMSDYVASPSKVYFGMLKPGQEVTRSVTLKRRSEKPMSVSEVVAHCEGSVPLPVTARISEEGSRQEEAIVELSLAWPEGGNLGEVQLAKGFLTVTSGEGPAIEVPWVSILKSKE